MILRSCREQEKLERVIKQNGNKQELINDFIIQEFLKSTTHISSNTDVELNLDI
jgi:hypothetical protein